MSSYYEYNHNFSDQNSPILLEKRLRVTEILCPATCYTASDRASMGPRCVWAPPCQCGCNLTDESLASYEAVSCLEEVTQLCEKYSQDRGINGRVPLLEIQGPERAGCPVVLPSSLFSLCFPLETLRDPVRPEHSLLPALAERQARKGREARGNACSLPEEAGNSARSHSGN